MDALTIITVLVITIAVIVYFGASLRRLGGVVDNAIHTTGNISDIALNLTNDTVGTYSYEVRINNAQKRAELADTINGLDSITTLDALDAMLQGKATAK